jgi:16S rRNA G966 N2-methylase RsmD
MANNFQIIGGEHRSRKFNFADAEGLRPTRSKVRETLFNWLQFELIIRPHIVFTDKHNMWSYYDWVVIVVRQ